MLVIAAWEEGASWRAQGWVGENDDRSDRAMHPSQVAIANHPPPYKGKKSKPEGIINQRAR